MTDCYIILKNQYKKCESRKIPGPKYFGNVIVEQLYLFTHIFIYSIIYMDMCTKTCMLGKAYCVYLKYKNLYKSSK